MRHIIAVGALSALALAAATPALAEAPKGVRVEALVGYDNLSATAVEDLKLSKSGIAYGVGLGYDLPVTSGLALGVDAEFAGSGIKVSATDGVDSASVKVSRDLYLGGRFTATLNSAANVYLKVGYTNLKLNEAINNLSQSETGGGFRIGVGGQIAVSKAIYGLVEYRHSSYAGDAHVKRNQALAGLGVRF